MPVIFQMVEKSAASGRITINPRSTEMIFAGSGHAVDVNQVQIIRLNPTKGHAVK